MAIEIGLSFIESDRVLVLARPFRFLLPPSVKMYCVLLRVFLREERVGESDVVFWTLWPQMKPMSTEDAPSEPNHENMPTNRAYHDPAEVVVMTNFFDCEPKA